MKIQTKEQISNLVGILATVSLTGVGFALGGTMGAEFMKGIGINLTSSIMQGGAAKLKEHWLSSDGALNHDIQRALSRANIKALENLEKRYIELVKDSISDDDKESIKKFFRDLNEQAKNEFPTSLNKAVTEQDVKDYLYGNLEIAVNKIWERISRTNFLDTHREWFKDYFINYFFSEMQFWFGEELKTDNEECNKAWRAFQRLLLEGIQAELNALQESQDSIKEKLDDLKKLDKIGAQLELLKDQIDRKYDEPFQSGLEVSINKMNENLKVLTTTTIKIDETTREVKVIVKEMAEDIKRGSIEPETRLRQRDIKRCFLTLCKKYGEKNKKILIVGDVMLDHKMVGIDAEYNKVQKHQIIKLGGEVYTVEVESKTLGGAADIARAFAELSDVTMIGVIGSDCEGTTLKTICDKPNIKIHFTPIETKEVLTTTKIYIHRLTEGKDKEVIRFDRENSELMTSYCNMKDVQDKIIKKINEAVNNINCIVIKDHQKGMISKELVKKISEIASNNKIPLYVDPKYDWEKFKDVKIAAILPNMKEAASGLYDIIKEKKIILERDNDCKLEDKEYETLVRKYPNCDNFIIKAASKGAVILSRNANDRMTEIKPLLNIGDDFKTDVGCGDVFDAFAIIGRLHGHTLEESVLFANFVAGLKTKKPLGELMSLDDIKKELEQESFKKYIIDNVPVVNKIIGI